MWEMRIKGIDILNFSIGQVQILIKVSLTVTNSEPNYDPKLPISLH